MTIVLEFRSPLDRSAAEVWAVVSTMTGINDELAPWVRIRVAERWRSAAIGAHDLPVEFDGWLLAARVVPFDRHRFRVERVLITEGEFGFDERSGSILQRVWVHRRRVVARGDQACEVADHLEIAPRVAIAERLVRVIVVRLFRHRHRVLRSRFARAVQQNEQQA